jgi:5-methylcytosine-specific restriction endonuclease McrA
MTARPGRDLHADVCKRQLGPAVLNFLLCDQRPTGINSERRSGVRNRKNYGKNQTRKARRRPRPQRTQTNRITRQTKQRRKIRLAGVLPKVARARRSLNFGDSYTCTYCLQVIHWDHHRTRPTKDHFFPKSKKKLLMGAKTTFIICCQPCNSRKSDKVFSSIEEVREFITSRKKALR